MLSDKLKVGQVVRASAGRDEGKLFFIVKIVDSNYVLIADGKSRKLERPKLKKVKHLKKHNFINCEVERSILIGKVLTDSFLRVELSKLK